MGARPRDCSVRAVAPRRKGRASCRGNVHRLTGVFLVLHASGLAASAANISVFSNLIPPPPVREVRVLLASDVLQLQVSASGRVRVAGDAGRTIASVTLPDDVVLEYRPGRGYAVGSARCPDRIMELEAPRGSAIRMSVLRGGEWADEAEYPGRLRIEADENGVLSVLNILDVETYVSCVVAEEIWPSFSRESFRAQAIIARSFALFTMQRRADDRYDVRATEASQVYRGFRHDQVGRNARIATQYTYGIVCAYEEGGQRRLFPTYYSSCCGGVTQSESIFGNDHPLPVLAGGVECPYCRIAPNDSYRWGPIELPLEEVVGRAARRFPEVSSLGSIRSLSFTDRAPSGRPIRITLCDDRNKSCTLLAESFRIALGARRVPSAWFNMEIEGDSLLIRDGRGFGHGVGLCQWGMEGMAREGKTAGEILTYYFPGCLVTRVY